MSKTLDLLVLEDDPYDAELVIATLEEAGYACQWERVETQSEFLACLETLSYDAVLADYSLPAFDGLTALGLLRERDPGLPFILVSGTVGEEIAIESLKAGATDYVLKDRLSRLGLAVQRALREREEREQRQRAERLLQTLNRAAQAMGRAATPGEIFSAVAKTFEELDFSCMFLPIDDQQRVLWPEYVSLQPELLRAAETLTGLTRERFAIQIENVDVYRKAVWERKVVFVESGEEVIQQVLPGVLKRLAGQLVRMLHYSKAVAAPLVIDDEVIGVLSVQSGDLVADDLPAITAFAHHMAAAWHRAQLFEQAQQELSRRRQAEETSVRLTTVIEQAAEVVVITDREGTIQYVNPAFERVTGYGREEAIGQSPRILKSGRQGAAYYRELWATIASGRVWHGRVVNKKKDGSLYTEDATISPVRDEDGVVASYVAVKRDVTDELELEERYRQAQKMEAIGRLAGGVAHDFNNLLTVIQGYTSFVLDELQSGHPVLADLEEISRAADRASALTAQLLAFSRRQTLQPSLLNLNDLIDSAANMLRRLIGEDVELHAAPDPRLGRVLADPAQLEQVIMNLSVNARDAMPKGGTLTFETGNVTLGEAYAEVHPGVRPGAYVRLAVSDTGTGMSEEVKAHLFEPFYTTKGKGEGTGLGLATVWGIVEQSGGHVEVYSELGIGSTFKVYLPRVDEGMEAVALECSPEALPRGTETILLVEDEELVRELAHRTLEEQGYTVLSAGHPDQALCLGTEHPGAIHILVTDVVMPGMGGKELAERLVRAHPETKVLFISGYPDNAITHHGVLEPGIAFLQKPFVPAALVRKVGEVLAGPNKCT